MMKFFMVLLMACWFSFGPAPATVRADATPPPRVVMETSRGTIVIALHADAAPETTANFIAYVESGFYDNTIFHRVIKGFMIQGGGFTADMQQKTARTPITNEADNGLKNTVGTIAMARTRDPHSATAQFFINVADNAALDHKAKKPAGWGYCVFGQVVEGMEVVHDIEAVATTASGGHRDVPTEPVVIQRATMAQAETVKQVIQRATMAQAETVKQE